MIFDGVRVWVEGSGFCRWGRCRSGGRAALAGVGVRRRGSFRRMGFWVQTLQGEKGVRGGDQGDVVLPAGSGSAFVVVQAEAGLDFAVVMFDAPAQSRPPHQGALGRRGRQVRQPVLDRLVGAGRPSGDQPRFGWVGPRCAASRIRPAGRTRRKTNRDDISCGRPRRCREPCRQDTGEP